jgi:hypothetical protein
MSPRRWIAIALAVVGAAMLVRQAVPDMDVTGHLARWWPLTIVMLGLVGLLRLLPRASAMRGPLLLVGTGAVALLFTVRPLPNWTNPLLVPVLLLGAGIGLMARDAPQTRDARAGTVRRELLLAVGRPLTWDPAQQSLLMVSALLSGCQLIVQPPLPGNPRRGRLEIAAVLSGIHVVVPSGMTVHVDSRALGGRQDVQAPWSESADVAGLSIVVVSAFTAIDVRVA